MPEYTMRAQMPPVTNFYGERGRLKSDVAHPVWYKQLDEESVGNTCCPRCNKELYTIANAVAHVRKECRQTDQEKASLDATLMEAALKF